MTSGFAARVRKLMFVGLSVAALAAPGGALAAGKIVGGDVAPPGSWSFAAYVEGHDGAGWYSCTGSVIAPNVVLTAGHCAVDERTGAPTPAKAFKVYTGAYDLDDRTGRMTSAVTKVLVGPRFDLERLLPDEALLVLATPTTVTPVAIATRADTALYTPGAPIVLAGWGIEHANGHEPSKLQTASTTLQGDRACAASATETALAFVPGYMFCSAGGGLACKGDSGGPVLEATTPTPASLADWRLIGTTSWGDVNCDYLSVAASVLPLSGWITAQIAIAGGAPAPAAGPLTPVATPLEAAPAAPAVKAQTTVELHVVARGPNWFRVKLLATPRSPIANLHVRLQYDTGHGFKSFAKVTLVSGRPYVREFSGDAGHYDVRAVAAAGPAWTAAVSPRARFDLAG